MRNVALLVLALFCLERPAHALEEQLRQFRGIRSAGMGGVITTTGVYTEALFGNPARHSAPDTSKWDILDLTLEINDNLVSDSKDLSNIASSSGTGTISNGTKILGRNEHLRAQFFTGHFNPRLFDKFGFGIGLLTSVQANLRVNYTTDVDTQTVADFGPAMGLSYPLLNDTLFLGMNLRLMYRAAIDDNLNTLNFLTGKKFSLSSFGRQGIGIDGDLGAFYKIPWELTFMRLNAGLSISNLVKSHYDEVAADLQGGLGPRPASNDRVLNLGLRLDFPDSRWFKAPLFAVEFQDIGSTTHKVSVAKEIHMGGEVRVGKVLHLRAGLNQGYPSAGLGLDLPVLKLDFATYGEELTGTAGELEDRRFVFRLALEI